MDPGNVPVDRPSVPLPTDWGPVADEHEAVRAALARIDEASHADRSRGDLARMLVELHELLRQHFRREERDEYFGAAFLDDPLVRGRIDQLILQHRELLARLGAIQRSLAELPASAELSGIASELDSLFTALRWHDAVETGLMRRLQAST